MRTIPAVVTLLALVAALAGAGAQAQDKVSYERRTIARLIDTFAALDTNRDGTLARQEAQGNVEFTAIFNDIDINRDGLVTKAELDRFLVSRFGRASPE